MKLEQFSCTYVTTCMRIQARTKNKDITIYCRIRGKYIRKDNLIDRTLNLNTLLNYCMKVLTGSEGIRIITQTHDATARDR